MYGLMPNSFHFSNFSIVQSFEKVTAYSAALYGSQRFHCRIKLIVAIRSDNKIGDILLMMHSYCFCYAIYVFSCVKMPPVLPPL